MRLRQAWSLLTRAFSDWSDDKASSLAAALAFYTALSLAPLVVIIVGIIGIAFGDDTARGEILAQVRALVGQPGAETVKTVLEESEENGSGIVATVIGGVVLLFGASAVFGALQDSLNTIFEVKPKPGRAIWQLVKERFLSFSMVLVVAFLLLVSLALSAALSAVADRLGGAESFFWHALQLALSFAVISALFGAIFRIVPDAKIAWRDAFVGGVVTAALFTIGKFGLGLYLAHGAVGSAYGAAGSLLAMLVWVYYSAQIVFFGAEFTQAFASQHGTRVVPEDNAVPIDAAERIDQGRTPRRTRPAERRAAPDGRPSAHP